ncbi:DUF2442 domain-containing protein [Bordetella flabilis]|uniref:DUF2442 domain-containing protein n=1 Tax=Bordetella flabilis TaxID=463014 RepID=A0A193GA91_9BORD|nr:DUF2442 domain-containing protein [Bordetella flabilis]ANN76189.1 hypothetical protein BAU07_02810 [Bordetella flabilis]
MNQQFLITHVAVIGPKRLKLTFADGYAAEVDLSGLIAKHPTLTPLHNRKVFAKVAIDEWRRGVIFGGDDNLSLASDNLRALALEQAGEYSHQHVIVWMYQNGLTLDDAARALGISRRMLAYYRSGEKPVPRSIGLAMLGWESLQHGRKAA